MLLFNKKTLQKALIAYNFQPTPAQKEAAQKWAAMIADGSLKKEKETAVSGEFKQLIMQDILGYCGVSGDAPQTMAVEEQIGTGRVDLALGQFAPENRTITAPFELKGAKTSLDAIMAGRSKTPVEQAWEYGMDAVGASWVLVSNYLEIRLYAVGHGRKEYIGWQLENLADPQELASLHLLLSAQNLLTGKTKALLVASEQEDQDITNRLYSEYKTLRGDLISTICAQNETCQPRRAITFAQKILDRVLFTAFAEDTGLLPENTLKKVYEAKNDFSTATVWDNFKTLFQFIDKGNKEQGIPAYNGGLFAKDSELDSLIVPDDICHEFKKIGDYDFASEVTVHILGHLFEQSITDIEAMQAEALGQKPPATSKKKQDGVVYTPPFVTAFIIEQTLGRTLKERFLTLLKRYAKESEMPEAEQDIVWKGKDSEVKFWTAYREELFKLRILDPACGSGAFLIAAFDYLESEYNRVNGHISILTGGTEIGTDLFDTHSNILTENLYGVDLNLESIEITKLSMWLRTANINDKLKSLDDNIKRGNSIIADKKLDEAAFNWKNNFPKICKEGGFDIVIGNPPYVRQELIKPYKDYLKKHYKVYHGVVDLYAYFYELGLKYLKQGGRLGYISSSTFFRTSSGQPLRLFMTKKAQLESVIDFGDLQIFPGVTTYPVVMTCQKAESLLKKPAGALDFIKLTEDVPENLAAHFEAEKEAMPQKQLGAQSWQLESKALANLRQKIKGKHKTLKQLYGSPLYGIKTGLNEAFIIDRAAHDQLIQQDPKSGELLKPFLEGKDLKKWRVEHKNLSLVLMPRGWTNQQGKFANEAEAWAWLSQTYPAIAAYLAPFEQKAKKRTDKGDYWWELRACAYYDKFDAPKIIYPVISQGAKFSIDTTQLYGNDKIFILNGDETLLALLNSYVSWFYLFGVCSPLRGGQWRLELREQNISTIPIPKATKKQKTALAILAQTIQQKAESRYAIESAVRQRIPDLCPSTATSGVAMSGCKLTKKLQDWPSLDFTAFQAEIKKTFKTEIPLTERNQWENWLAEEKAKIQILGQEIALLEQDLNKQVYTLFKLTKADIELLENSLEGQV